MAPFYLAAKKYYTTLLPTKSCEIEQEACLRV